MSRRVWRARLIVGMVGLLGVAAACTPPPTNPPAPTLTSITVTPSPASVDVAATRQLTATAHYSDGSSRNITDSVGWTSSSPGTATVSNAAGSQGLATGVSPGTTTVTAARGIIAGTTSLTVQALPATLVSVSVTPTGPSVVEGTTVQLTATGTYSDGSSADITSTVIWTSNAPAIVSVSNAAGTRGLATGVSAGQTDVSASSGSVVGSTTVTVNPVALIALSVAPVDPTIISGATADFTVLGTFSDGSSADVTDIVTWSSSDPGTATVSNAAGSRGRATGIATGTTTITAQIGPLAATSLLTVV